MAKLKSGTRIYGTSTIDTSVVVGSSSTINSSGINVTGIITAGSFRGDGSQLTGLISNTVATSTTSRTQFIGFLTSNSGIITAFQTSSNLVFIPSSSSLGIGTTNPSGSLQIGAGTSSFIVTGIGSVGIGTLTPQGALQIGVGATFTLGGNAAFAGIVTANSYRGDGSLLTGIIAGVSISTNTTNQNQFIPYAVSFGSTTGFGATTTLGYNPSTGNLGIGTTNPTSRLQVQGNALITGIVTASSFKGDGTGLRSVDGQSFNTGISTSLTRTLSGIGDVILNLPSTTGIEYVIHSILATNIGTGNTEFNVIGAFDFSASERSYFAYNIPIPTGTSVELLKQPQVLNPSDRITMRSTDVNRVGIDSSVQVYISYESKSGSDYFGVGLGTVGIAVTDLTTVYTSLTNPSIVQSIRLTNRTDSGAYPVSVSILRSGVSNLLVDNLIVPKYSSVELLDAQKQLYVNDQIQIQVDQTSTIDIQVSGKQIIP